MHTYKGYTLRTIDAFGARYMVFRPSGERVIFGDLGSFSLRAARGLVNLDLKG